MQTVRLGEWVKIKAPRSRRLRNALIVSDAIPAGDYAWALVHHPGAQDEPGAVLIPGVRIVP